MRSGTTEKTNGRLLRAAEVAEILKIHVQTVYNLSHRGKLPKPMLIGTRYRWRADQIERIVAQTC